MKVSNVQYNLKLIYSFLIDFNSFNLLLLYLQRQGKINPVKYQLVDHFRSHRYGIPKVSKMQCPMGLKDFLLLQHQILLPKL